MSASISRPARSGEPDPPEPSGKTRALPAAASRIDAEPRTTLHVQTVFHGLDERQAQTIATELIGRAHELANQPASECDVDVSVKLARGSSGADASPDR